MNLRRQLNKYERWASFLNKLMSDGEFVQFTEFLHTCDREAFLSELQNRAVTIVPALAENRKIKMNDADTYVSPTPVVGMGATLYGWSDSYACTITAVLWKGRKLILRKDKTTLTNRDEAAKGAKQEWSIERDAAGEEIHVIARQTKDGPVWKQVGTRLGQVAGTVSLGERIRHHDFHFMKR